MDKPLTEKDIEIDRIPTMEARLEVTRLKQKVQSAKRLLKWELLNIKAKMLNTSELTDKERMLIKRIFDMVNVVPDACFQIDDGDKSG